MSPETGECISHQPWVCSTACRVGKTRTKFRSPSRVIRVCCRRLFMAQNERGERQQIGILLTTFVFKFTLLPQCRQHRHPCFNANLESNSPWIEYSVSQVLQTVIDSVRYIFRCQQYMESWKRALFLNRSLHDSNYAFAQSRQGFLPVITLRSVIPVTE